MPTFRWSDLASEAIDPEHSAATGRVYRGEQIEVALVRYPAGSRVTPHASPHEQVHSILKGRARFRVGTEEKIIGPGEAVLVRSGVQHAAEILEELESKRDIPDALANRIGEVIREFKTHAQARVRQEEEAAAAAA